MPSVALPADARRVVVRGSSGSGKTTLAASIAAALRIPHVELDGVFHQPGWVPLAREEFRASVASIAAGGAWVTCGNYSAVSDLLLDRADTVVFFDLPRSVVMRRVIVRSLRRRVTNEELWNGNREEWRNLLSWDPERNIVRWTWVHHARRHEESLAWAAEPPRRGLRVVRIATLDDERSLYSDLASRAGVDAVA